MYNIIRDIGEKQMKIEYVNLSIPMQVMEFEEFTAPLGWRRADSLEGELKKEYELEKNK